MVSPIRETTSRAEHLRNTSPTKSVSGAVVDEGKCHGELNVSVRARCCSAITRRDILCKNNLISIYIKVDTEYAYRAQDGVHEFVHVFWLHEISTFQHPHCQLWNHSQVLL